MAIKLRCPHCDGEIKDVMLKYCPHCREELSKEELMKQAAENDILIKNKKKIRCPVCDKEIDEDVTSCPFCGKLIESKYTLYQKDKISPKKILIGVGVLVIGVFVYICILYTPKKNKVVPSEIIQNNEPQTEYVTEIETYMQTEETYVADTPPEEIQEPIETTIPNENISSAPSITLNELNAVKEAVDYLQYSPFSRQGLIEQLMYSGFSYNDAVYGVDNCEANWKLEAIEAAESYLKFSSFSKEGLIDQLKYDGFTDEESVYGVDIAYNLYSTKTTTPAGADAGMANALESALNYLKYTSFSYKGLVDQLEYDGYSNSEAIYAADNCRADWNEQAALTAANYLKYSSFSRTELMDQLLYEGYTYEQASYGVRSVGY